MRWKKKAKPHIHRERDIDQYQFVKPIINGALTRPT